jgi:hypothetical protein
MEAVFSDASRHLARKIGGVLDQLLLPEASP